MRTPAGRRDCRTLDGLPLAIEFAACRVAVLRLELRFAERGRVAVLPSSRHLYGWLYGRGCRSRDYGILCFSVATTGTLAAWSRECDENDGLNGFGQKSLRHTQFPIVRDRSEPTSPALVRLASA